jgi:hypothetical protein
MKNGILTPVHKKDKHKQDPGNYIGKVVTDKIQKILESILKTEKMQSLIKKSDPVAKRFY